MHGTGIVMHGMGIMMHGAGIVMHRMRIVIHGTSIMMMVAPTYRARKGGKKRGECGRI